MHPYGHPFPPYMWEALSPRGFHSPAGLRFPVDSLRGCSHVWLQTRLNSHNLRDQCGSLCNMFKVSCHRDIRGGRMFQGSPGYLSDSLRYIPLHVHVRQTSGDSHELCRVPADLSGSLRYIPLHVHVRQTSGDSHELCRVRQIPENSDRICAKIRGVV